MASQLLVWGFCSGLLRPSPVGHLAVAGPDLRSAGGSLLPPMNDLRPARTPTRVSSGPFFPSSAATDSPIMSCTSTPLSDEALWPWAESALHRAFVYLCLVCTKRDDMYGKDGYPDDNNHEIAQSSFKALMEPLDINRSYAHILRTYYQPYKPAHLLLLVSTIMVFGPSWSRMWIIISDAKVQSPDSPTQSSVAFGETIIPYPTRSINERNGVKQISSRWKTPCRAT